MNNFLPKLQAFKRVDAFDTCLRQAAALKGRSSTGIDEFILGTCVLNPRYIATEELREARVAHLIEGMDISPGSVASTSSRYRKYFFVASHGKLAVQRVITAMQSVGPDVLPPNALSMAMTAQKKALIASKGGKGATQAELNEAAGKAAKRSWVKGVTAKKAKATANLSVQQRAAKLGPVQTAELCIAMLQAVGKLSGVERVTKNILKNAEQALAQYEFESDS